jgi:hypothetical protein
MATFVYEFVNKGTKSYNFLGKYKEYHTGILHLVLDLITKIKAR